MLTQEEVTPIEPESLETKGLSTDKNDKNSLFSKTNSEENNNESQNVDDITEKTDLKNEKHLLASHISVTSSGK